MDKKIGVLFVCHGNICRSPMAEYLFKDMVSKRGIGSRFNIESAATTTEELGQPVHPGTYNRLLREGILCKGHKARLFKKTDYDKFDLIICMDEENMRGIYRIIKEDPKGKIHKMLEFAGCNRDVADPWYTGDFDATYDDIYDGCVGLLSVLGVNE